MIDDKTKQNANALVNDIKSHFGSKLRKRPISKTYETKIDGLGQNNDKNYIGRFFNVTDNSIDLAIWAGYDPNPNYDFNVSFSFKKVRTMSRYLKMYYKYMIQKLATEN